MCTILFLSAKSILQKIKQQDIIKLQKKHTTIMH